MGFLGDTIYKTPEPAPCYPAIAILCANPYFHALLSDFGRRQRYTYDPNKRTMRKLNMDFFVTAMQPEELSQVDAGLMAAAREALENAYAPYSQFNVGAAVLLADGTVVRGSNQENAAYPSGLCAERTAIFAAGSNYPNQRIVAVAVTARPAHSPVCVAVSPCGACRQVMLEYEVKQNQPIRFLMQGENGETYLLDSVECLLPLKFSAASLGIGKT